MKHVLAFLGLLAAFLGVLLVASPAKGQAVLSRVVHFLDPVPRADAGPPASAAPAAGPVALGSSSEIPEWRRRERDGDRLYEDGDFPGAAAAWAAAASGAPASEGLRLRARADRANVFRLLADGVPRSPGDPVAAGQELRRRIEALKSPTAGAYLELADYAAANGLDPRLAFLYEQAFERKTAAADEVQAKVTKIVRRNRAEKLDTPKEVLDALIRELPTSEAADIAREETGLAPAGGNGVGGVARRGAPGARPEDQARAAEAFRLMKAGDAEYRQAVPGSKDVNKHRRAALDAYVKARELFEEVDRGTGVQGHQKEIHDCNRNIAELRKDLPVGK